MINYQIREYNSEYNLYPEQGLVYCWHWEDDETACKIGKSTVKSFKGILSGYGRWHYKKLKMLGFEICDDGDHAYIREAELHDRFERVVPNREWVYLDKDVLEWLANKCYMIPVDILLNGGKVIEEEKTNDTDVILKFDKKSRKRKEAFSKSEAISIDGDIFRIIKDYKSGLTLTQISKKYGYDHSIVKRALKRKGVRKRYDYV